jgi:metallophosphoesterase (TIGR00282 family)
MRILFLGDIVGQPGRATVKAHVRRLRAEAALDLVLANGENASGGFGLSAKNVPELFAAGIDGLTSGNHIWKFKNLWNELDTDQRLLRPHNQPEGAPGSGVRVFRLPGLPPVAVINLQGRTFMTPTDCPFAAAEAALAGLSDIPVRVVDFHAEATSEKLAMAHFLDGRVSALVGTHTHVQTNDAVVLPGGTAYITDLGMCGPARSCIGMRPDAIIERFRTGLPVKFEVASGPGVLQGAVFDIDDTTGRALSMAPFRQE